MTQMRGKKETEPLLANLLSCVLCLLLIADGKELTVVRRQRMSSFSTRTVVLSFVVGVLLLCSSLTPLAREAVRMPKERVSFIAEATTTVLLRRRPPNLGYLFIAGPGNGIGLLEKGERVKVKGRKIIRTFFGDDIWVRVSRLNQEEKEAWAYFGTPESSPYFRRVKQGE
jgi:hypothetical protein